MNINTDLPARRQGASVQAPVNWGHRKASGSACDSQAPDLLRPWGGTEMPEPGGTLEQRFRPVLLSLQPEDYSKVPSVLISMAVSCLPPARTQNPHKLHLRQQLWHSPPARFWDTCLLRRWRVPGAILPYEGCSQPALPLLQNPQWSWVRDCFWAARSWELPMPGYTGTDRPCSLGTVLFYCCGNHAFPYDYAQAFFA